MTFRSFFNIFTEKYISYNIPQDRFDPDTGEKLFGSKEKLMYDFYVLSYLDQFNLDANIGPKTSGMGQIMNTPSSRRELDEDTKESFRDAKKTLLPFLKTSLSNAVFFAVCAEFRHILDANNNKAIVEFFKQLGEEKFIGKYITKYKMRNMSMHHFLTKRTEYNRKRYINDDRGYLDSFKSVKDTGIDSAKFISMAERAFTELSWPSMFGGQAWAGICKGWTMLNRAQSDDNLFVAIDHIYDLQHNTDTVFNKLNIYKKNGEFKWIKQALDHKANLSHPHELLTKCSGTIKVLALRILKSEGFAGWDDFINKTDAEQKKPDTQNNIQPSSSSSTNTTANTSNAFLRTLVKKFPALIKHVSGVTDDQVQEKVIVSIVNKFLPYVFTHSGQKWYTSEIDINLMNASDYASAKSAAYAAAYAANAAYDAFISTDTAYANSAAYNAYDAAKSAADAVAAAYSSFYAVIYASKILPDANSLFIQMVIDILDDAKIDANKSNKKSPIEPNLNSTPEPANKFAEKLVKEFPQLGPYADKFTEDIAKQIVVQTANEFVPDVFDNLKPFWYDSYMQHLLHDVDTVYDIIPTTNKLDAYINANIDDHDEIKGYSIILGLNSAGYYATKGIGTEGISVAYYLKHIATDAEKLLHGSTDKFIQMILDIVTNHDVYNKSSEASDNDKSIVEDVEKIRNILQEIAKGVGWNYAYDVPGLEWFNAIMQYYYTPEIIKSDWNTFKSFVYSVDPTVFVQDIKKAIKDYDKNRINMIKSMLLTALDGGI